MFLLSDKGVKTIKEQASNKDSFKVLSKFINSIKHLIQINFKVLYLKTC